MFPLFVCLFLNRLVFLLFVCWLIGLFLCLLVCLFVCLCLSLCGTTSWWGKDEQNFLQTLRSMSQVDLYNHRVYHKMSQALLQRHLSYISRMYTGHDSTGHSECRRHFPLDSEHKETCGSIFLKNKSSNQAWFTLSLVRS